MSRLHDLDAYVTGELDDAAGEALEEQLFADPDDPDLAFLDRLARDGARLTAHGTFYAGVTRAELDQLVAAGHRVQVVDLGPPGRSTVGIDDDAELVVTRLAIARPDAGRVDLEITLPERGVTKTIRDVLVDPVDGAIYGMCERPLAKLAFGVRRAEVRVLQRDPGRTVLATWSLHS